MAVKYPEVGKKVFATVIEASEDCTIGIQLGDEFELSSYKCGDFCGYFYHDIYPWLSLLQFDGTLDPESPDVQYWDCPNKGNVKIELRRIKD